MASVAAQTKKNVSTKRRPKGEQTRQKIIEAVLNIIAREGTRGVTHRAVADQAKVQLSLTTYYFADINAMIREAFVHFSQHARPDVEQFWGGVFEHIDHYSTSELRKLSVREQLCEELAVLTADYITSVIINKPVGLAVEQVFFTHTRLSAELRMLGEQHRRALLEPVVLFCRRFNREDPEIDAELLLNSVTTLEYQALATHSDQIDRDTLQRLLQRHIGWVLGVKRA